MRNRSWIQSPMDIITSAVLSNPRIREVFTTLGRTGQVSVAQIEPVIGDTILNTMQQVDMRDGRDDNRISRQAIISMIGNLDGLNREQRAEVNRALAAIPANGIALHPENVNRVVSSSLRAADANDDWQLTISEVGNLANLVMSRADEMVEKLNLPQRASSATSQRTSR